MAARMEISDRGERTWRAKRMEISDRGEREYPSAWTSPPDRAARRATRMSLRSCGDGTSARPDREVASSRARHCGQPMLRFDHVASSPRAYRTDRALDDPHRIDRVLVSDHTRRLRFELRRAARRGRASRRRAAADRHLSLPDDAHGCRLVLCDRVRMPGRVRRRNDARERRADSDRELPDDGSMRLRSRRERTPRDGCMPATRRATAAVQQRVPLRSRIAHPLRVPRHGERVHGLRRNAGAARGERVARSQRRRAIE